MKKFFFLTTLLFASITMFAAELGEGYTKVTDLSTLKAGDEVVLYCDDAGEGVTGWNSNKDATVSTTESEWVKYLVEVDANGVYLKDGDQYIAGASGNEFKYSATAGALIINTEDGAIGAGTASKYLYKQVNGTNVYYRMYTDKSTNNAYTPFFAYVVAAAVIEPQGIVYNLDGGKVLPATNEELYHLIAAYYPTFAQKGRVLQAFNPAEISNNTIAVFLNVNTDKMMTDATSEYKWLGDYMISKEASLGETGVTNSNWTYSLQRFLYAHEATVGTYGERTYGKGDWSINGQPEAWQAACADVTFNLPTSTKDLGYGYTWDFLLPSVVKEGFVFKGWKDAAGNVVTTIPANTETGTYTAQWEVPVPQPTELWITPNWGEITAGESLQLTANFDIEGEFAVTWTSSNEALATVSETGLVTAAKEVGEGGQVTITATYGELSMSGYYAILPAGPQGISITAPWGTNLENLEIAVGGTLQLEAAFYPEDYVGGVVWTSSDETLATVSSTGLVTSLVTETEATVTITATAEGYPEITTSVEVKLLGATVTEPTTKTLYAKMEHGWWKTDGAAIGCYYWDVDGAPTWPGNRMTPVESEADLWTIEVPVAVTTVIFTRMAPNNEDSNQDWGAQTADLVIPEGMNCYTITSAEATWGSGTPVAGEWSVYPAPVPTELFVTPNYGEVKIGGTLQLKAIGDDEKEYPAVWTSNRADVLVSETGLVTVTDTAALGQAVITAEATFGELVLRGQSYLAIIAADPVVTITAPASTELAYGKTLQLAATTEPADAEAYWITWATDNDQIATITTDGLLTAVGKAGGVVKVIAGVEGYDVTDTIEITCLAEVPQLNVYASGLKAGEVADGKVEISYLLNATATALEVQLLAGETVVKTIAITDAALLAKGAHTTTIDIADVETGTYTWAIKAAGEERTELSADLLADDTNYDFYQPRGVAADINPESPFFGQLYMGSSKSGVPGADGADGAATPTGVAIFDALLAQQGTIYGGGVTWEADGWGPGRIKVGEDGMVYVNDHAKTTAGVFKMDPANPTADFTPVLDLAQRGVTFALPVAMEIIGSGAERTLYTWNYIGVNDGQILKYAIGENDNYALAPDTFAVASFTGNQYAEIAADGRGGFWLSQNRGQIDGYHALAHMTSEGVIDYTSGEHTDIFTSTSGKYSTRGIVSLNKEKNLLAMAWDKTAVVFAVAYDETTGAPTLTKVYATSTIGTNVDGICFDYAGNLFVGSASSERLHVFATPSANVQVTPAAAANTIIVPVKAPTDPQLNVFAYDLSSSVADNQLTVKYALNAYAEEVTLLILDGEGAEVAAHTLGAKLAGAYEATVSLEDLAEGNYTWAIEAAGEARTEISAEILNMPNATYWQPRDMAFDKNPESPFFGQIYVSNSAAGGGDAYVGNKCAIYTFNPLYELQGVYDGGIAWANNNAPHRLYVDEEGLVYASNRSDEAGGIYIMDPANPEAPFKSLFDPAQRGVTYTKITGFDFAGEGADRVLVTADAVTYDSNLGSVGNILKYAIGECKENFAGAPDTLGTAAQYSLGNQHNQIAHDGRGGWWIAQNRGSEGGIQCLIHVAADGTRDYRSNTDGLGIGGSAAGALAVSDDYTLLAMAADNGIKVFAITWGEDGKPALELKYYTGSLANNMTGVDFDYAGNILTGSLSSERLYAFALPSENVKVTPAASKYAIAVNKTGTSLESAEAEQVKVRKVFENGQIYIIRDGVRYTITGIVVE